MTPFRGADFVADVRQELALARLAASAAFLATINSCSDSWRAVMSRTNAANRWASPVWVAEMVSSAGNSPPSRCRL